MLALPSQDDAHYVELSEAASVNQQISTGGSSPPTPVPSLVADDILVLKDLIDIAISDASQVSDGGLLLCYYCLFHALSLQQQH